MVWCKGWFPPNTTLYFFLSFFFFFFFFLGKDPRNPTHCTGIVTRIPLPFTLNQVSGKLFFKFVFILNIRCLLQRLFQVFYLHLWKNFMFVYRNFWGIEKCGLTCIFGPLLAKCEIDSAFMLYIYIYTHTRTHARTHTHVYIIYMHVCVFFKMEVLVHSRRLQQRNIEDQYVHRYPSIFSLLINHGSEPACVIHVETWYGIFALECRKHFILFPCCVMLDFMLSLF
jgi:hypothetical protein